MDSGNVMVAVSKHSSSVSAVKWALSKKFVPENGTIKLVHVRPAVRTIPTPMGNYLPISQVSPEIVATYKHDVQLRTEQMLQPHQQICDVFKVQPEFVIVESDVVEKALLKQVSRLGITKLIIGTSHRNVLMRKLKRAGIPEYIAKNAPDFCTVLVVTKSGLVSVKAASGFVSPVIGYSDEEHVDIRGGLNPVMNNSISSDHTLLNHVISPNCMTFASSPNWLGNASPEPGEVRGFMSQPLPLQREQAASSINHRFGRSQSGPSENPVKFMGPRGSQIFFSPFWIPRLPAQSQAALHARTIVEVADEHDNSSSRENLTNSRSGWTTEAGEIRVLTCVSSASQSSEDQLLNRALSSLSISSQSSEPQSLDKDSSMISGLSEGGNASVKVDAETPPLAVTFPLALIAEMSNDAIDDGEISAARQINRLVRCLDSETLAEFRSNVQNIQTEGHNNDHQPAAVNELEKLRFELEETRLRVKEAEEVATWARLKAKESEAQAKEEAKGRKKALIGEQLAKKEAAEEARKRDEAVAAMEAAKQVAEEESRRRKEAEDRARQEAIVRQQAMAALLQAQRKYREYSFEELCAATNDFSEDLQIGEGGYGSVFMGTLHHTTVAIKILKQGGVQGPKEFQQEVELLGQIHHPHMVLLLGACPEKACLVYEYLANGSLEDRLFCKGNTPPLPWYSRFRIAAEVATALLFLHSSKPEPIVHRDLKPANILLDSNFVSKIGDVGLAHLVPGVISYSITEYRETVPVGTFAYIDPEYQRTGVFCPRSDVYALGMVILQLLTGQGPVGVAERVENALEKNILQEVLDPDAGDWPFDEARDLAVIALRCAELRRRDRPDLEKSVLPVLEKNRALADDRAAQVLCNRISAFETGSVVPSFFLCPILQEMMEDPHIAADGFTYEYGAIKEWLQEHSTSPMTNLKLIHKHLTPNHSLRSAIYEWASRTSSA